MTNNIYQLGPFCINEATGMGSGLYNISCLINDETSLWFDAQEKDWLLTLPENEFIEYACKAVGIEDISEIKFSEYQCTDPDAQQYVKQISEKKFHIFEISEFDNLEIDIVDAVIDINSVSKQALISSLASYGYYYDYVSDNFIDKAGDVIGNSVIAECIFEDRMFV